jgi:hypothetical protein
MRQTFQVQYVVEGSANISQVNLPNFKNFEVEQSFDYSTSTSYNGKGLTSYSKIIVLLATKKGKFTVPGASAVIDGKHMRSNDVQILVKAGAPGTLGHINPDDIDTEHESELHPGESISDKIEKNFFLRVEPSKTTCYVGEPLMVVYKAYSRLNANSQVVRRPSLTGFSVMEMVDAYDGKPSIEKLNGRYYYTNLIRKVQLFPLQEGNYVLDPAEIESVIHFVKTDEATGKRNSLARLFKNTTPLLPSAVDYRTVLRTQPLTITVKPLPTASQPADFSGAVGQFNIAVKLPSAPIHKGVLVKIQVVISGSGNLSLLTPPAVKWPKGIDTTEPSVKENVNKYVFPLSGSKTFEYTFAAPDTGDFTIPAIHFPYYEPAAKKYKTASCDAMLVHVLPGVKKTEPDQELVGGETAIRPQFYWFALVVVVILASIVYQVIALTRAKKRDAKKPATATPVAPKTAADILATAHQALQHEQSLAFYHEVQDVLWNVMATRYNVLPSQMNKYHIAAVLTQKGVSPQVIQNFTTVLDECEWALYTPSHQMQDMAALLTRAEQVVDDVLKV